MNPPTAAGERQSANVTRVAGRGLIYITLAKLLFIVAGYAVHFALPRLLGSKDLYGLYGVVNSLVNVLNMVLIQGTLQSVSKLVSEDESRAPDVQRSALKIQAFVGGGIALAYFASADLIASWQNDPTLALYYRISAGVVLSYGFYAVFIGILNGSKRFRAQALFDMSYATGKTTFVIGAAALGLGLTGVFGGFAIAAAVVCAIAAFMVGARGGRSSKELDRRLITFMLPVMAYTLILNLLLNVDLWVLKASVGTDLAAPQAKLMATMAAGILGGSGGQVGDYTAAQVLARIPYQATLSVTFVVFPLISRSTFSGDRETTRGYIGVTLRYSLVMLAGLVAVIAAPAAEVILVPYPQAYLSAAPALQWLVGGMLCFALFAIMGAILNGSGRTILALLLGVGTLALDVVLCLILIPRYGGVGAAWATSGALLAGTIAGLVAMGRVFSAGVGVLTVVRVGLAVGAVFGASHLLPSPSRLITVAKCAGLGVLYFAVLIVTRELGRDDLRRVRQVFTRR